MPVFEFRCKKTEKVIEKFFTTFSRYEEESEAFFKEINNDGEFDFEKVFSTPSSTVFDGQRFGFKRKGVDGDFRSRMNQIHKNNKPKTYGKQQFGKDVHMKTYNLGSV